MHETLLIALAPNFYIYRKGIPLQILHMSNEAAATQDVPVSGPRKFIISCVRVTRNDQYIVSGVTSHVLDRMTVFVQRAC